MSQNHRIRIADVSEDAVRSLSEDDIAKIQGGAISLRADGTTSATNTKVPGSPAPPVPIPFPNLAKTRR